MNETFDPISGQAQGNSQLNDCGCCEGVNARTPVATENPPGLPAIAYRVGTHARFLESMKVGLSADKQHALQGLTTRDQDSFSIALLEGWAMVADVLTFYQERIANESYLGTATERKSISELGRLIGYRPKPGVAASAYLAFNLEELPDSPQLRLPTGIKVQSVPGPDEKAKTFETVEAIEARAEWNAIKPRLTQPQQITKNTSRVVLQGTATSLKPGDSLLFIEKPESPTENDDKAVVRTVLSVAPPDNLTKTTSVNLTIRTPDQVLGDAPADLIKENCVFVFRQRAAVFGHNALIWDSLPAGLRYGTDTWKFRLAVILMLVALVGIGIGIYNNDYKESHPEKPNLPIAVIGLCIAVGVGAGFAYVRLRNKKNWEGRTLEKDANGNREIHLDSVYPRIISGSWVVLQTSAPSNPNPPKAKEGTEIAVGDEHHTQPPVWRLDKVESNTETSRSDFTMNGKVSRLTLKDPNTLKERENRPRLFVRGTSILAQSEPFKLAEESIFKEVAGVEVTLGRTYPGLKIGQRIILIGERSDGSKGSEIVTLKEVREEPKMTEAPKTAEVNENDKVAEKQFTKLSFTQILKGTYKRASVALNANVALATHGESVPEEVLGSGDSRQRHQQFILQQPPLTYVSADTPAGAESTLKVYVNDVQWRETEAFQGHSPNDRIFITRMDDEGNTIIEFGDGNKGARLPTGSENVRARYRVGIGCQGSVKAGQLSQLMTRPFGVKGVTNPLPASGGEDRQIPDEIRENAPLSLLTLGRLVSFKDYEDYAGAFPGVAKAIAVSTWDGQTHRVFVTVAGPNGEEVKEDGNTYLQLKSALNKIGDPRVVAVVKSYKHISIRIAAKVTVDPDRKVPEVLARVKHALSDRFSFKSRTFGQKVTKGEVIAVMQNVPGVVSVTVGELAPTESPGGVAPVLPDPAAKPGGEQPAELLTLDESSLANIEVAP